MGKQTFYEVLGVQQDASTEEIKKQYRILALKCHPDKNLDNTTKAAETFTLLQEAYSVLSDPKERAWYDRHKDTFHADSADVVDHSIDEVYLTSDCYTGYDDSPTGFYTVYRDLFDEILEVETPHRGDGDKKNDSDSSDEYPRFGNSKTDVSEVKAFYDRWQAFSTAISFAHLDKYDIRDAPNRRVVRLMEKENKKIRDEAKKNRNSLIQELVQFVRKKDKRMDAYRKMLEAKVEENRKKSADHRRKVIEEGNRAFASYVESEWTSLQGLEENLKEIEANAADYYDNASKGGKKGKGGKKKRKGKKVYLEEEDEEEEEVVEEEIIDRDLTSSYISMPKPPVNVTVQNGETTPNDKDLKQNVLEEDNLDDEEEEDIGYYCRLCNKKFKTINAFQNHEKSKKHLTRLEAFNALSDEEKDDEDD